MKAILRDLTPPLFWRTLQELRKIIRGRNGREWEYIPDGWAAARSDPRIKGWNSQGVLDTYRAKWSAWVRHLEGPGPLAISPEAHLRDTLVDSSQPGDCLFHNMVMSYAYALALAGRHRDEIHMLDWGGGMGHYYLLAKALFPDLEIDYHCKDLPLLTAEGERLLPDAHFYQDETCLDRSYNFVLSSSSLQYSPQWDVVLMGLAQATDGYLLVTRLPIAHHTPSYVCVQRPYSYGYETEYLGWCLNRGEFLRTAEVGGLQLIREFLISEPYEIYGAPELCEHRGYLFQRSKHMGT